MIFAAFAFGAAFAVLDAFVVPYVFAVLGTFAVLYVFVEVDVFFMMAFCFLLLELCSYCSGNEPRICTERGGLSNANGYIFSVFWCRCMTGIV